MEKNPSIVKLFESSLEQLKETPNDKLARELFLLGGWFSGSVIPLKVLEECYQCWKGEKLEEIEAPLRRLKHLGLRACLHWTKAFNHDIL